MSPVNPPHVYAEWLPLLDCFREGDDSALEAMRQGTIEWTNVVAERWTSRVTEALTTRLKEVSRQLQLGLNRSGGDTFAISRAILGARRSIVPLFALASLPCAPEDVRKYLTGEVERFLKQAQETLEKGAREIRIDNGRVLKAIRDNPLTAPVSADLSTVGTQSTSATEPPVRGRRIII